MLKVYFRKKLLEFGSVKISNGNVWLSMTISRLTRQISHYTLII